MSASSTSAASASHAGAMIALVPTSADLDRLALPGGEPRDELHLTLWYLGDVVDFLPQHRQDVIDGVRRVLGELPQDWENPSVIFGSAFGVAYWNPASDYPAWVLNVGDAHGDGKLTQLREVVEQAWEDVAFVPPRQHTPWQPHVCVAYSTDDLTSELESRLGPIKFNRVRVAFGTEVTDIDLAQPATVAAALGGDRVPWHTVHNHAECPPGKPWAVVQDSDGHVAGCHATQTEADDQLAALYASDSSASSITITYVNGVPTLTTNTTNASTNSRVAVVDQLCVDDDDGEHFGSGQSVSNASWDGAASRFSDAQYQHSAAACDPGSEPPKTRCFLPHHEPGGAVNRGGVHAAAARFNQLSGRSSEAVARAKSHLRSHYHQLGESVPDVLKAEGDVVTLATAPPQLNDASPGKPDASGDCGPGYQKMPDGTCLTDDEVAAASRWSGVLVVEGVTTGDGREFGADALTWADRALLRWQKEGSHGGEHDVTVSVGRIDRVWRDGNVVYGEGVLNLVEPDGWTIYNRLKNDFAGGISIDADDISDADVEFVWGESTGDDVETDEADDMLKFLFGRPEKVIYHAGRVRAATLVDIPAFVEACITLVGDTGTVQSTITASSQPNVVAAHETETVDEPWKLTVAKHLAKAPREAYAAWYGDSGHLLHHDVVDGVVGAANLNACAQALAQLTTKRGIVVDEDELGVYEHLAAHLRSAGLEPPPFPKYDERLAMVAAAEVDEWRPPSAWFSDPKLSVFTGITVTDQGRVYGHVAPWGECHIGYNDECVSPPYEDQHPYFMTGEVLCADGARVAVGQITVGIGHAPISYQASRAAEHYDNTSAATADVTVGNDSHGIWCAGAVRPYVEAARVHQLRASGRVSGDWRRIGGQLRLVGVLAVNVPGFPIPQLRARVASGVPQALVAAGTHLVLGHRTEVAQPTEVDLDQLAMRRVMDILARRVHEPSVEGV